MKKLFKWLFYVAAIIVLLIVGILATAYWNRDKLLTKLNAELNKGINGEFHIDKLAFTFLHDFPNFSVTLHDVYLRASHYEKYHRDIFSAEKIFVNLRMYPLFKNELKINSLAVDNADIFIYKARNGDTNTDVFKKSQDSTKVIEQTKETPLIFNLNKITFHNVSVVFADSVKNKFINFQFLDTQQSFVQEESGYSASVKGDMHFDSLFLNPKGGSYLKDKNARVDLNVDVNRLTNKLLIRPSSISYKKNEIGLKGDFELKKEGPFTLVFNASNINYEEVKSLLNSKLIRTLSKYKLSDPATVQVSLLGRQIPGYKPEVDVEFETTQKTFKYNTVGFSSLVLKGTFTNHIDDSKEKDNKNSKVTISSFKALMEKIPIAGNVTFTQLQDPVIDLSFTSKGSFNDISHHIDNSRFTIDKGNFVTAVKYRGKLSEYLDSTRTSYQGKLNGSIKISNISLHYKPKQIHLDQIELTSSFNEKLFTIEKLNLNVNGSPISVNGKIENFIPFFIRPQNKGYVKLSVHSPNFNLTSLTSRRAPKKNPKRELN